MDYKRKSHSVYLLTYHIIFVVKYRKKVITYAVGECLKNHAAYICDNMNCELISAETDKDHIHLLVSMPPEQSPLKVVNNLKTQMAREVRSVFKEQLEKDLWGGSFWTSSYFIATTGSVSMETVKAYIEGQQSEAHQKKTAHSSHGQH